VLQSLWRDAHILQDLAPVQILGAGALDQPFLGEARVHVRLSALVGEWVHAIGVHLVKYRIAVVLLLTLDDGGL